MFTGIITHTGIIDTLQPANDGGVRLVVTLDTYLDQLVIGSSHAVNGVCLTLIDDSLPLTFDLSQETLQKTTFSMLNQGDRVNLEPGMRLGDPVDGHLVSGHVDDIGTVLSIEKGDQSMTMTVAFPSHMARYIAVKGSICIDGVSLTVNTVEDDYLSVTIIPHTLDNTRMTDYRQRTAVNLEIDLIARYLGRLTQYS